MNALIRRSLSVGILLCVLPTSAGARRAPASPSDAELGEYGKNLRSARAGRAIKISGLVGLGAVLPTLVVGIIKLGIANHLLSQSDDMEVLTQEAREERKSAKKDLRFTLGLMGVSAALLVTSLALIAVGDIVQSRAHARMRSRGRRWAVTPYVHGRGGGLSFATRF